MANQSHEGQYLLMSENHIYAELMAHLAVFFSPVGRPLGFGFPYEKTRTADLNVNESRWQVLLLMQAYGYTGEEYYVK